jgi:hypothetical protein
MALVPNGYDPREGQHDIEQRFLIAQDDKPTQEQLDYQLRLRSKIAELAFDLNVHVEDSREKSLAITKLEEALMWAGKAIFK